MRPASALARAARALAAPAIPAAFIAAGAFAEEAPDSGALYPAAQCAALWYGFDDYAARSAFVDRVEGDLERADAFRAVAYRLDGGRTARVDDYVATQRPLMLSMIDAMIYGGDRQSRDLFRRLTQTCDRLAAAHPETEALR